MDEKQEILYKDHDPSDWVKRMVEEMREQIIREALVELGLPPLTECPQD